MAPRLAPELEEAVRARIGYFRDLGVFDLYRRATGNENVSVAEPDPYPEESNAAPPAASEMPQKRTTDSPLPVLAEESTSVAPKDRAGSLAAIREDIGECVRCSLSAGRNKIVFGDGDPNARLMFVGEGPGADEDAQGLPFVGRAGQLLNNMINAMGLRRDQVYIANIVKCRPPQNRVPEPEEAHICEGFLFRQIDVIRPEVIVALGATAATYLLGAKSPLNALRGRIHQARGAKLIVTYHPAYLLRDPRQKKEAWADLQLAMAELGLKAPQK
ncbi:MAG TPA: uracil-DNA glycosylase [Acidobacteriaceae bacterium]|nr:uracil-DNA glycosylase [Acidobacteriaceae bacterium]